MTIEVVVERQVAPGEAIANDRLAGCASQLNRLLRCRDRARGKQRVVAAQSTDAATRIVDVGNSLTARIPLLAAELVRIRPVLTKARARASYRRCLLRERLMRIRKSAFGTNTDVAMHTALSNRMKFSYLVRSKTHCICRYRMASEATSQRPLARSRRQLKVSTPCRIWVKLDKTHIEHITSAVPSSPTCERTSISVAQGQQRNELSTKVCHAPAAHGG